MSTKIETVRLQLALKPSRVISANDFGLFMGLQPATKPATFATSWHRPHRIPPEVKLAHE
jgi:hypothetical protein